MGQIHSLDKARLKKAKILEKKNSVVDHEAELLLKIANQIDAIIIEELERGEVSGVELAGVLAHRLGAILKNLNNKADMWHLCQKIIERKASIEEGA